ncbi:FMN-binding glutamate synthase family protein [Taylorella equigenitalis]|uniref:Glutamate synthase n=1 Tax=Taylorella equigenitalis ATCC 35865 TaxID=743973 RepID=A0ABM5N9K1_9BURK|nr:FMN-binding glutamate synthase family protein [Taylorella equigenitalis]AFN35631.1 putative glutamate synthase [Taylorella equigenitalis ATCC 35865]ASY39055.1 FMN-binding glutamate synthase family protein [Taylorella equigenitalis]VEG30668.1 Glutamate synthase [NADPH] large chain precursor [Taylorella equigenitalis ATCC 35865]
MAKYIYSRYTVFGLVIIGSVVGSILAMTVSSYWLWLAVPCIFLTLVGIRDLTQTKHAVTRNYPVIGNMRYILESIRPEIRQYFLEQDNEILPFSRNQRAVVYQRAKQQVDKRPFGTIKDVYEQQYEWINHSMHPTKIDNFDFRTTVGGSQCKQPYSISIFNISAMSFGALSKNAILSLNRGAKQGGFAHDTGEGGISKYHMQGGDLIWNIGSGYFGCRNSDGTFSDEEFAKKATQPNVKMIELKVSQGAKPGHGGILPGAKVTPEIAEARGVPVGEDCNSPAFHPEFDTPIEMMHFIQRLRDLSGGKPVGFKICIGHAWEFFSIAKAFLETGIYPDFIVVDGAEGGTGAAPIEFADHVGTPLREGLRLVHNTLVGIGLRKHIKIGAAGKIITAFDIARTLSLGADWCNAGRGFMFAVGCIQAQACHTDKCPTGVATQDPLRTKALVVEDKAYRVYNYHKNTLHALSELLGAAGLNHPSELRAHHIARRISPTEIRLLSAIYPEMVENELIDGSKCSLKLFEVAWPVANAHSFHLEESAQNMVASFHKVYGVNEMPPNSSRGHTS